MVMFAAVMIGLGARPCSATNGDRALLLGVTVNGNPAGVVTDFVERGGRLFVRRSDLEAIGVTLGATGVRDRADTEMLPLDGWPSLSHHFDERSQTIDLAVPDTLLRPTRIRHAAGAMASDLPVESGWGAVLNYDLFGTSLGPRNFAQFLLDGRVFTPHGVAVTSILGRLGPSLYGDSITRLESNWVLWNPDSMLKARIGDVLGRGLSWTRPVRIGGVQIGTDFAARPDLVTFPTPTFAGSVAVPSSVDVLVNGVRLLTHDVQPGPFEVRQLPIVTGAGEVSVVTRDSTGQDVRRTLPIYASTAMLASGLSSFSAEVGVVRLNYGLLSDDYRAPAGSVTYRRGLFDHLTAEIHAEGTTGVGSGIDRRQRTGRVAMAGGGLIVAAPHLGALSLGLAGSASENGRNAALATVAAERISPGFSVSVSAQATTRGFADTAAAFGDPFPRVSIRGSVGWTIEGIGTFGMAYAGLWRDAAAVQAVGAGTFGHSTRPIGAATGFDVLSLLPAQRVSVLSASFSRPVLGEWAYLYVNAFRDFGGSTGVMAGISISIGPRATVGVSASAGRGQTYAAVQASQGVVEVGDLGWQAQAARGDLERQFGLTEYKSPWGRVTTGVDRTGRQTAVRAGVQGALAFVGGNIFAANTLRDSFAVVDTGGEKGVGVLHENRLIGRTDGSGQALVPNLRSFEANRLAIDPSDVPIDADALVTSRLVRPRDRSGVMVRFPVTRSRGALLRLVDATGMPLPVGATVSLQGHGAEGGMAAGAPVGFGGEAYLTALTPWNRIEVTLPDGARCFAEFGFAERKGELPVIGAVPCRAAAGTSP